MAAPESGSHMAHDTVGETRQSVDPTSDIVSVNDSARTGLHPLVKLMALIVTVCAIVIGALVWFTQWQKSKRAEEAQQEQVERRENRAAQVGIRRQFDTDAAALARVGTAPVKSSSPGEFIVPDIEVLPGEETRPIPLAGHRTGESVGRNGQMPMSRFGGDVLLPTTTTTPTGTKTQIEDPTPQREALTMLRTVIARMDTDGTGTGSSAERQDSTDPTQANPNSTNPAPSYGSGGVGGGTPPPNASASTNHGGPHTGSFGGALTPAATPKAQAGLLGNRSLVLPKGRTMDCALTVRVISGLPGMATCVLNSDVYSDNGRVVLLERGSEAVGEYSGTMVQGQQRLFILWNRVKTPHGVTIELNSPAADELGAAGIAGYIDRHWWERLGAAFMLSIIQDAIGFATASQAGGSGGQQLGIYQNSAATGNRMAERILESTINIKPTLYKNQGDRAEIFVARDLDFSGVYELRAN